MKISRRENNLETATRSARELHADMWRSLVFHPIARALNWLWLALTAHVDRPSRESRERSSP